MGLDLDALRGYLEEELGADAEIEQIAGLEGEQTGEAALKQFGYGHPLLVSYRAGGRSEKIVFHTIRRNAFGRERDDDRVAAVWLDFHTFNKLPYHVPAVDIVIQKKDGRIQSIKSATEVMLVTAYRPGRLYAEELLRIRDQGVIEPVDIQRAERLAACLAEIHEVGHDDPILWRRRLRDLVGHGEGIMGLVDSFPPGVNYAAEEVLRAIEEGANRWRWRLKQKAYRLCRVHGDFHPFNVLFDEDSIHLLDRSRGEWGEPADDVSCMSINYIFFSLQRSGCLEGGFSELHERFWEEYLRLRHDEELVEVIQPWFAWRALVLASPLWYPTISEEVRRKILAFARRVLDLEVYDYHKVNDYISEV